MQTAKRNEEFYIGYDAMPKLGRVKTGNTPTSRPPPLDFSKLQRVTTSDESKDEESEYEHLDHMRESDSYSSSAGLSEESSITSSSFLSEADDVRHSTPAPSHMSGIKYDDRRRVEQICGIQKRSSNEDIAEMILIIIFAIFAFLVFSDHFS